jgi:hypothetical protein
MGEMADQMIDDMALEDCPCGYDEYDECRPCGPDEDYLHDMMVDDCICCSSRGEAKQLLERYGNYVKKYIPKEYLPKD